MTVPPFIAGLAKVVAVGALMAGGAGGIYIVSRTDDGNDATQMVAETATASSAETATPVTTPDAGTPAPTVENGASVAVTPVSAAALGRTDCPAGWAAVDEPNFSLCYPTDSSVRRGTFDGRISYSLASPRSFDLPPVDTYSIAIAEDIYPAVDLASSCEMIGGGIPGFTMGVPGAVTAASGAYPSCLSFGRDGGGGASFELRSLRVSIPLPSGSLDINANYTGLDFDAQRSIIDRIFGSLVIK